MLFLWKDDMVRFMRDASERSDFHALLAQKIVGNLGIGGHICDAGCGLGYLSQALSPYYDRVTAIDVAPNAISRLQDIALPNVTAVCGDIHSYFPEVPYDKMVFCLFGALPEVFSLARRQCRGKVIIIKKNWRCHTFSVTRQPNHSLSLAEVAALLDARHIPYEAESCALELGQPLRSLEDAVKFFRLYSHDPDPDSITAAQIAHRLKSTGDPEFPYYVPARKQLGILTLDACDIPADPDLFGGLHESSV